MNHFIIILLCIFPMHQHQVPPELDSLRIAVEKNDSQLKEKLLQAIDTTELSTNELASYYHILGVFNYNQDNYDNAYKNFLKAKTLFLITKNEREVIEINKYLINTADRLNLEIKYVSGFIEEICHFANETKDPKLECLCLHYKISRLDLSVDEDKKQALSYLWTYKNIAERDHLKEEIELAIFNLGTVHLEAAHKDSALYYFNKAEKNAVANNDLEHLSYLRNNKAILYRNFGDFDKAIQYHLESIDSDFSKEELSTQLGHLEQLAKTYSLKGDAKNASLTYEKALILSDSLNRQEQALAAYELETRFQTTQKEKENLQLKADKEAQKAQIYALAGGTIILFISGLFLYNNQRKKKLIAQKENEIEKSRADSVLKNQELATIDAMISGQEKERKKLAEELHDDLGSTLTTVKLYFENLKHESQQENSSEVFKRTEKLLYEAYEKIRNMSHTRNSGILASKGLIPTLESLAKKITESGKINLTVIHHGLDQSLENSLELTIFRIIQELVSNIVKHARATEAVISLTAYEDSINIMVEDNGIGFIKSEIEKNGIGLYNIEKRVENLDGTMEIDSHLNHGTTINLDIPLI